MVAHTLDHGDGPGVAHAEALADHTAEEQLAAGGAVADHVAGDHVLLGDQRRDAVGAHDHASAREPLADVVVGVTLEPQRDAARQEGAERLPGRTGEGQVDRAIRQPLPAVPPGQQRAQHRAHGAVDVADRQRGTDRLAVVEGLGAQRDELVVEGLLQPVVLGGRPPARSTRRQLGHVQDRAEVEAAGLPVLHGLRGVQRLGLPDRLLERPEPERRQVLAHLLRDVLEERLDEDRRAGEARPQLRVLRGDTDGAGVEVADPHQDAAHHHERGRREAVLLGPEERRDHDVAPGLELAIGLHDDPVPQPVEQQRLLGLGQAELPRAPRVLERGQGGGAGTSVVARDQHHVGVRLGDTCGDGAHPDLGDELHVHPRLRVRVLEVVDQLGEVLDRVDVVVRRRRDQADAGRRVPRLGDPRVDLVAGQLAALSGLGSLRHLDLDVVGVDQVLAGHPEPAARHLLDGGPLGVASWQGDEPLGVLAALAGVGLAAQPVHGDRQGLVRLLRDRPVRHRTRREPLDDLAHRLDLVDRHRLAQSLLEAEEPAQGHQPLGLRVHTTGVLLEDVVASLSGGVLQLEDGLRVEQVRLALAPPLVLPADVEPAVRRRDAARRVRRLVPQAYLLGDDVEPDAAELGGGPGEVPVDDLVREADRLEALGATVGRHRRDPHLGHDLQDTLAERLDQLADRLLGGQVGDHTPADQVLHRLHRQVGVHGGCAVADQQRDVMDLAHVPSLDEQRDTRALLDPDQVLVHRRRQQQRRDGRVLRVGVAIGQHHERGA